MMLATLIAADPVPGNQRGLGEAETVATKSPALGRGNERVITIPEVHVLTTRLRARE